MDKLHDISQRQSGAALIISLVILTVMTLIALSAFRMTNTQERMSGNFQFQTIVFQGAESAIRGMMNEINGVTAEATPPLLVESLQNASQTPPAAAPVRNFNTDINADGVTDVLNAATLVYQGEFVAPGFSMGAGGGTFVAHRYRIAADSNLATTFARAQHLQGVQRIGPSASN